MCSSFSGIQSSCGNLTVTFYSVLNCFAEAAGVLGPACYSCYCLLDLEICAHLEAEHAMSWLVVSPPRLPTHSELLLAWILNKTLLPNRDGKKYFDSSPKIQYWKKKEDIRRCCSERMLFVIKHFYYQTRSAILQYLLHHFQLWIFICEEQSPQPSSVKNYSKI